MTEESPSRAVSYLDRDHLEHICADMARDLFSTDEPIGFFSDHDPAKLDSCLKQPCQALYGNDLYPTLYRKAAVLYYLLNRDHPFGNGNKRMSAAALAVFLFINDHLLTATSDALRDKTLWVAQTTDSMKTVLDELEEWIKGNTIDDTSRE